MISKILKGLLFSALLSSFVSCSSKKEEPAAVTIDKEQIKKDIQAKENEFADTYNAGVLKDIGYYAEDATSFSENKPPLVGKQAIVDFLVANIDTAHNHKISFTTNEVFVSNDGNQVVEIGYYKLINSIDNSLVNSGNYMSLFEKRDGHYYSVRDMSVSDLSGE